MLPLWMPIQDGMVLKAVPLLMLRPHEEQCLSNHGLGLDILAKRGGITVKQALCIMKGASLKELKASHSNELELVRLVAEHYKGIK